MAEQADPNQQEKTRLKELLNAAHTLRLSFRGAQPSQDNINRLKELCQQCLDASTKLSMEHGKGLSMEMLAYAKICETEVVAHQVDNEQYTALERDLLEAEKIALGYQDRNLETRILEGLANIYRRTDQFEREIDTIEKAIRLSRSTPKVMALLDAFHRVINYLFDHQPNNTDDIVKFHTEYWSNYLWLKEQPDFNRDSFIKQKKVMLYKVAIYIGSIAGNPLHMGEQDPEDYKIAQEAYDEAIYIATLLKNNEFLCAAHAHKALLLMPRLSAQEKKKLLGDLKQLEETYQPENEELSEMINLIEKQVSLPPQESGR